MKIPFYRFFSYGNRKRRLFSVLIVLTFSMESPGPNGTINTALKTNRNKLFFMLPAGLPISRLFEKNIIK